jgi:hypothetical protein
LLGGINHPGSAEAQVLRQIKRLSLIFKAVDNARAVACVTLASIDFYDALVIVARLLITK